MDQDMNSWELIDPGKGGQQAWRNAAGYALYRATIKPTRAMQATGGVIMFHELIGSARVYLDGKMVGEKGEAAAAQLRVPFPAGAERMVVSVMVHGGTGEAGIAKRVELTPQAGG
jgi:hypothetical protein